MFEITNLFKVYNKCHSLFLKRFTKDNWHSIIMRPSKVLQILPFLLVLLVTCKANFNWFSKVSPSTHIISIYVYFDKFNSTIYSSITLEKIVKPLGVRWLLFVGNKTNSIVCRGTFRLTQPSNLIIIPLNALPVDSQVRNNFLHFRLFTKVTSTLIMYLINEIYIQTRTNSENNIRLTITKYAVSIQAVCLIVTTSFTDKERYEKVTKVLTTSHFHIPDLSENLFLKAIKNPRSFHRIMLRSGNLNKIGMVVFALYAEFFDPLLYGNNRNACKDILFGSPS